MPSSVSSSNLSIHLDEGTTRICGTGIVLSTDNVCITLRVDNTMVDYFGSVEQLQKIVEQMSKALTEAVSQRRKRTARISMD